MSKWRRWVSWACNGQEAFTLTGIIRPLYWYGPGHPRKLPYVDSEGTLVFVMICCPNWQIICYQLRLIHKRTTFSIHCKLCGKCMIQGTIVESLYNQMYFQDPTVYVWSVKTTTTTKFYLFFLLFQVVSGHYNWGNVIWVRLDDVRSIYVLNTFTVTYKFIILTLKESVNQKNLNLYILRFRHCIYTYIKL